MQPLDPRPRSQNALAILVLLTLLTSAIHFADNALRTEVYPGPVWLTPKLILATWSAVAGAAYAAYRSGTRGALTLYSALGFAGFAHLFMPHEVRLPLRCLATIMGEAATSVLLLVYVWTRERPHHPEKIPPASFPPDAASSHRYRDTRETDCIQSS